MKDLGKNFSLYDFKGFGPCFLLQIAKKVKTVPRADELNFRNLQNFFGRLENYTPSECRGDNGCLTCTSIGERLGEFVSDS